MKLPNIISHHRKLKLNDSEGTPKLTAVTVMTHGNIKCQWGCRKIGSHILFEWEYKIQYEEIFKFLINSNTSVFLPRNSTSRSFSTRNKNIYPKNLHILSREKQRNKIWYIHTIEYCSETKRMNCIIHICENLKNTTFSEGSQTQNTVFCTIPFIYISRKVKHNAWW